MGGLRPGGGGGDVEGSGGFRDLVVLLGLEELGTNGKVELSDEHDTGEDEGSEESEEGGGVHCGSGELLGGLSSRL